MIAWSKQRRQKRQPGTGGGGATGGYDQRHDQGYDGFAADVWGLGAMLFAALTGVLPLNAASADDAGFCALRAAQQQQEGAPGGSGGGVGGLGGSGGGGSSGGSATRALLAAHGRPCRLSRAALSLLDEMLVVDPERRATVAQVRAHPWLAAAARQGQGQGQGLAQGQGRSPSGSVLDAVLDMGSALLAGAGLRGGAEWPEGRAASSHV